MMFDPEAAYAAANLGRRGLYVALIKSAILGAAFCWGLGMVGADPARASVVAAVVAFLILAGIGWHKLQQLCLGMFAVGLLVWTHIPLVDRVLELATSAVRH